MRRAQWCQVRQTADAAFEIDQLVILEEVSLAGTLSLDRITALEEWEGVKVLLVGDCEQIQSVDA